MWYPKERKAWALLGLLGAASVLAAQPVSAAVLDVCPTCTHTTLDSAFTAAQADDVIILDGPDLDSDPPVTYTLTTDLVIDTAKDGLQIRGKTAARPDKIIVEGTGAGPVITVEQGFTFKAIGFTITGGSTGILAMKDSDVDIRRCLIETISGIGVDCTDPKEVYIAGSVIKGCTSDAVRLDLGGELNMTQCTLINNTGLGVNSIAGVATVASCLIYDSGAGLDGTGTSLKVGGNWVTDAGGVALPMPTGVTDAYAITDLLDPVVTFESDSAANPFPGDIDNLFSLPLTGQPAATLSDVPVLSRDFSNVSRNSANPRPGADENGIAVTTAAWIECEIVQRGAVRNWVGEGPLTIYLVTENQSLVNSLLWISNITRSGIALDIAAPANRLGGFPVQTPSAVDSNYGFVDYVISRADFVAGFPNIANVDTTDYEISIQPNGVPLSDTDVLDQLEAVGSQAEVGRVFGLDTKPPTVRIVTALADQFLTTPNDGSNIDGGPAGWGAGLLLGNVGANGGVLSGATGDPQVFFDGVTSYPGPTVAPLSFGVHVIFDDLGSGFATTGLPSGATANLAADKAQLLYREYADVPGMAWWTPNTESDPELIAINNNPTLSVTYSNATGTTLDATWSFANAVYGPNQWHALANIRVTDLAGNELTLDPSNRTIVPLRPFHLWWLPVALAEFRDGPSGGSDTNPVFTWGLARNNGQEPQDPNPCPPSVQYYVLKLRTAADGPGLPWIDISGQWSDWQNPANRTISLDSIFTGTATLRDVILAAGGQPDRQYVMLLRGYDEAGNLQTFPDGSAIPAAFGPLAAIPPLAWNSWTDPGVSEAAALDTKVQSTYWYNADSDRFVDAGERTFGAASRIPLPGLPPEVACAVRVEAGFKFTMQAADSVSTNVDVYFELYEDGRLAASGIVDPTAYGPDEFSLVIPQDLFGVPALATALNQAFLNESPCSGTIDRLGDEGEPGSESTFRKRDVKYQLICATRLEVTPMNFVFDPTPATVEFTVTVDRTLKEDQPVKRFTKE